MLLLQHTSTSRQLTVTLCDLGCRRQATCVDDTAAVGHDVLVRILAATVVVKRVDDTQVEQHTVEHLQQLFVTL